ncbi:hypothetical protein Acj9p055 [Acinetobacter phage Acj9]|uniref:Uncharacterized protein n=1 Tax=Acinetobacter phage Acj9 TaxID=760939 RepID=E5EPI9_9CAUD|nr:hypothetical protein Acj9p055 [Acinetobacter phage Acj9]ADG59955.1 hypothetical protein Acj9p055 [Acinetobacter phage Acj9]
MINISLTRQQLDVVLAAYCEQIGLSYSTMHDEAFCAQGSKGYWLHLWYDGDTNILSHFVKEIEKLIAEERLNLRRTQP